MLSIMLLLNGAEAVAADSPMPGSRITLTAYGGQQHVAFVDEVTSPVRWRGEGWSWSVQAEVPWGSTVLRGGYHRAEPAIGLDGVDLAEEFNVDGYVFTSRFTGRQLVIEDGWLDARWPLTGSASPCLEVGAFTRIRAEYHGDTTHQGSHGFAAVVAGPLVRCSWRLAPATEVALEGSVNLMAWVLRPPYLGFDADRVWQDDVNVHTVNEFVHSGLQATARHGLGERLAIEATAGFEFTWTNLERRYQSAIGLLELGLVVGL